MCSDGDTSERDIYSCGPRVHDGVVRAVPVEVHAEVHAEVQTQQDLRGTRRRLPGRRVKDTFELRIGGRKLFVEVGLYEDGTPGEVFLSMSKPGSDLMHFVNGFAIAISLLLQYGAPLSDVVHSFESLSGGPNGDVSDHETISSARSIIDLVAKVLHEEYGTK